MNRPVRDEELFMEEALAAIRRAITDEQAGEMTFAGTEPATFGEDASPQPTNNAGLLSRKATAAVGSAFNRLSETARKHEPTLEERSSRNSSPHAQILAGREFAPRC